MGAGQKAPAKRQRVGKKATAQGSGTSTPKGGAPKPSATEAAVAAQEDSVDPTTWITCQGSGSFQLRAAFDKPDGTSDPEWTLEFNEAGLAEATPDDLAAVEQVLAGTWTDRRVAGRVFAENARMVGLGIKKFGLEAPPMATWDTLEENQVVPVAIAAGAIQTVEAVKRAIRYEKQSGERQPKRDPRASIVAQLEAQLQVLEASAGGAPTSIPVVNAVQGGNVVGTAGVAGGLVLGQSELG